MDFIELIRDASIYQSRILVADDDADRAEILRATFEGAGYRFLLPTTTPSAAIDSCCDFKPDLAIFCIDGKDAEQYLRKFALFAEEEGGAAILALSYEDNSALAAMALRAGASDFVLRAGRLEEAFLRAERLLDTQNFARTAETVSDDVKRLFRALSRDVLDHQLEIMQRLGRASDYRDDETGEHTRRVGALSAKIAAKLGLSKQEVELIRLASPLHDIGKIGVRESILMKPGSLDDAEFERIKSHVDIGSRILDGGRSPFLKMAEMIARTHHERWDGKGYPYGIAGEEIPLPGRIVAVADVFDALISARPYKAAWPIDKAIAKIESESGAHFDPRVVDAFLEVMREASESEAKAA